MPCKFITLLLAIFINCSSFAQDTAATRMHKHLNSGVSLFLNWNVREPLTSDAQQVADIARIAYLGAAVQYDVSLRYLQLGIGLEASGYHTMATKSNNQLTQYNDHFQPQKITDLYASNRYISLYVFANAKKDMLRKKLTVYGGGMVGILKATSGEGWSTSFIYAADTGRTRFYGNEAQQVCLVFGLQAGIAYKLNAHVQLLAAFNSKLVYNSLGVIYDNHGSSNPNDAEYGYANYHIWYQQVALGIRYSR